MKEVSPLKPGLAEKIDRLISLISPKKALKRKMHRAAFDMLNLSYRGVKKGRFYDDWLSSNNSADEDLLPELEKLRERSRELNRNDAHAAGITSTIVTNVVGTGIRPQSRIDGQSLGLTDEQAQSYQKQAEKTWNEWTPYADAGNRMDFVSIQQLVLRQILENGEAFVLPLMVKDKGRPYQLALEVVEADRVATPTDKTGDKSIRSGIELGKRGEPVAYWIKKTHPGEYTLSLGKSDDYVRYPARNSLGRLNVLHLYIKQRSGQSRGVPLFAPVMTLFKDLSEYLQTELLAARIAACFAIFIKKNEALDSALAQADSQRGGKRLEKVRPGIIEYLNMGEEVHSFTPNRPGDTFEPFVERVLRAISSGLNMPYEVVAKDFSRTNYSSARASLLEARRFFKVQQEWLSKNLCQPIWEMLLEEAFLNMSFKAKTFYSNKTFWAKARWIAPGWQWVDPLKEVKAAKESIDSGISSYADIAASQGLDWEETFEQIKREQDKKDELGLNFEKDGVKNEGVVNEELVRN